MKKLTQTSLEEMLLTILVPPDAQSGTNPATLNDSPSVGTYTTGIGMTTAQAETLGDGSDEFAEMDFLN